MLYFHVLTLKVLCICNGFLFLFYMILLNVGMNGSLHLCLFPMHFLGHSFFLLFVCLFVLSCSNIFVFVLYYFILSYPYSLDAYLFYNEKGAGRWEGGEWIWVKKELGKKLEKFPEGGKKSNQEKFYEKKSIFNERKNYFLFFHFFFKVYSIQHNLQLH